MAPARAAASRAPWRDQRSKFIEDDKQRAVKAVAKAVHRVRGPEEVAAVTDF